MVRASSSTLCAWVTMRSPSGVTVTELLLSSNIAMSNSLSSFFYRYAQRRLADKALFRRPAKMTFLGKSHDVLEFGQRHKGSLIVTLYGCRKIDLAYLLNPGE